MVSFEQDSNRQRLTPQRLLNSWKEGRYLFLHRSQDGGGRGLQLHAWARGRLLRLPQPLVHHGGLLGGWHRACDNKRVTYFTFGSVTFKKIQVFGIINDLFYETFPNLTKLSENFVLLVSTYVAITVPHLLQLTPQFHTEHEGWAEQPASVTLNNYFLNTVLWKLLK